MTLNAVLAANDGFDEHARPDRERNGVVERVLDPTDHLLAGDERVDEIVSISPPCLHLCARQSGRFHCEPAAPRDRSSRKAGGRQSPRLDKHHRFDFAHEYPRTVGKSMSNEVVDT